MPGLARGLLLTGRHGLFATYEAFAMVSASMAIQHAKWLEAAAELALARPVASLNVLLTSTCWRNDHNGFSHQGPGLIDTMISHAAAPSSASTCRRTRTACSRWPSIASTASDYVNLIVIDKQPHLQYLDMDAARAHARRGRLGLGLGRHATATQDPDVVLACAGDVPTLETLAAAALLRECTSRSCGSASSTSST